ncbi:hypothetical protein VP01_4439g1 [Puccinia sorghi]|uniref:Uncharacterized protein n=1 Tax=Puccinia sorghi TaxID=27349 RepID=A0A0L6URG4_9BASI|nr:hypothetical protein VP01_4439g1 [Puccinia sorghi]
MKISLFPCKMIFKINQIKQQWVGNTVDFSCLQQVTTRVHFWVFLCPASCQAVPQFGFTLVAYILNSDQSLHSSNFSRSLKNKVPVVQIYSSSFSQPRLEMDCAISFSILSSHHHYLNDKKLILPFSSHFLNPNHPSSSPFPKYSIHLLRKPFCHTPFLIPPSTFLFIRGIKYDQIHNYLINWFSNACKEDQNAQKCNFVSCEEKTCFKKCGFLIICQLHNGRFGDTPLIKEWKWKILHVRFHVYDFFLKYAILCESIKGNCVTNECHHPPPKGEAMICNSVIKLLLNPKNYKQWPLSWGFRGRAVNLLFCYTLVTAWHSAQIASLSGVVNMICYYQILMLFNLLNYNSSFLLFYFFYRDSLSFIHSFLLSGETRTWPVYCFPHLIFFSQSFVLSSPLSPSASSALLFIQAIPQHLLVQFLSFHSHLFCFIV